MIDRSPFRFVDRLRVRWAEVDMQKIVFNGHYLMYFDSAVGGWWRALGLPYTATMEDLGGDLYVRKAELQYLASARYADELDIGVRRSRIGNSSLVLEGAVFRDQQPLVFGELVYVFADPASQSSRPIPQALRDVLDAFEAGQAMTHQRCDDSAANRATAGQLWSSFGADVADCPAAGPVDEDGTPSVHLLLFNRLDRPLACGRLRTAMAVDPISPGSPPSCGRLDRIAVHPAMRGSGLGLDVVRGLTRSAAERGLQRLVARAPASAAGFFIRAGFEIQAEPVTGTAAGEVELSLAL